MPENKVVPALGTAISELKTTTGSLVGSLYEIKDRLVDTERELHRAQETFVGSDSH